MAKVKKVKRTAKGKKSQVKKRSQVQKRKEFPLMFNCREGEPLLLGYPLGKLYDIQGDLYNIQNSICSLAGILEWETGLTPGDLARVHLMACSMEKFMNETMNRFDSNMPEPAKSTRAERPFFGRIEDLQGGSGSEGADHGG